MVYEWFLVSNDFINTFIEPWVVSSNCVCVEDESIQLLYYISYLKRTLPSPEPRKHFDNQICVRYEGVNEKARVI